MSGEAMIRKAAPGDAETVAGILHEAAQWLQESGMPLLEAGELEKASIHADVNQGLYLLAEISGEPAGIVKVQLDDPIFWPDMTGSDSAYVHRLAVRRRFAGAGLSAALLGSAAERARSLGRQSLRLDCPASRPRLRAVYERFGFRHHSDRRVGPYFVSRYEYDLAGPPEGRR
jgi:GNAT superfamily N-acetyltransferase